jgi:hypothetical protein
VTRNHDDTIDFTMMYATHDAFRRDLGRLVHVHTTAQHDDPALTAGWNNFKNQLLIHHSVEDSHLWPRLLNATGLTTSDRELVEEMEAEHSAIDPLLIGVESTGSRDAARVERVEAFVNALRGHLDHEEAAGLPLIQSLLGRRDWRLFANQMRRRQGFKGASVYVPWVVNEVSKSQRKRFLSALPFPVRVINRLWWEPKYRRRHWWGPNNDNSTIWSGS